MTVGGVGRFVARPRPTRSIESGERHQRDGRRYSFPATHHRFSYGTRTDRKMREQNNRIEAPREKILD
jgi:hypothetical protein